MIKKDLMIIKQSRKKVDILIEDLAGNSNSNKTSGRTRDQA